MSILINGSPTHPFKLERGMRQGDPLSPFLFVMVAEAFNHIMRRAIERGIMEGIEVGREKVMVSHLQFADDTLVFCPAKMRCIINMRRLKDCFHLLTGLRINFNKSSLICIGREKAWARKIATRIGYQVAQLQITYLGIPLGANPRKEKTWEPVIRKVHDRLATWKAKVMLRAGRLTLIKTVLNILPLYYMGVFKTTVTVSKKLIKIQRNFFWYGDGEKKGIPLLRWDIITKPKEMEGLGVGDMVVKNVAMLFKWWWRFTKEESPLWKRTICSIYNINMQNNTPNELRRRGEGPRKTITSIDKWGNEIKEVIDQEIRMRLGNGRKMKFWKSKWLGDYTLQRKYPRLFLSFLAAKFDSQ